jgi:hypothetical protein
VTVGSLDVARAQLNGDGQVRSVQPVLRGSSLISLEPLTELLTLLAADHGMLPRELRSTTDAWLSPRLHSALRLTRREASEAGIWAFLAGLHPTGTAYVQWRWGDAEGSIAPIRHVGRISHQAFARLWWAAELFRDGADYGPVQRAFSRSELINLCLDRPFVRNRAFALALVDVLSAEGQEASSEDIAGFSKRMTLVMPTLSIEAATIGTMEDPEVRRAWVHDPQPAPAPALPTGPADSAVPTAARERAQVIVRHVRSLGAPI